MNDAKRTSKRTATRNTSATGWTDEERAAMKEHVQELKKAKRAGTRADGEADVQAKLAEMTPSDRTMAERIHAVVKTVAPDLVPRTWYGMPAYATPDGKVVCFFTPAAKFKERYATFGFNSAANLDDGTMWPTSWALTEITDADEAKIAELVKRAAG